MLAHALTAWRHQSILPKSFPTRFSVVEFRTYSYRLFCIRWLTTRSILIPPPPAWDYSSQSRRRYTRTRQFWARPVTKLLQCVKSFNLWLPPTHRPIFLFLNVSKNMYVTYDVLMCGDTQYIIDNVLWHIAYRRSVRQQKSVCYRGSDTERDPHPLGTRKVAMVPGRIDFLKHIVHPLFESNLCRFEVCLPLG